MLEQPLDSSTSHDDTIVCGLEGPQPQLGKLEKEFALSPPSWHLRAGCGIIAPRPITMCIDPSNQTSSTLEAGDTRLRICTFIFGCLLVRFLALIFAAQL